MQRYKPFFYFAKENNKTLQAFWTLEGLLTGQAFNFGFKEYVRFLKKDNAEIEKVIVVTEDKNLVIFNNQDFEDGKWEEKIEFLKR